MPAIWISDSLPGVATPLGRTTTVSPLSTERTTPPCKGLVEVPALAAAAAGGADAGAGADARPDVAILLYNFEWCC